MNIENHRESGDKITIERSSFEFGHENTRTLPIEKEKYVISDLEAQSSPAKSEVSSESGNETSSIVTVGTRGRLQASMWDDMIFKMVFLLSCTIALFGTMLAKLVQEVFVNYAAENFESQYAVSSIFLVACSVSAAVNANYWKVEEEFPRILLFVFHMVFYAVGSVIKGTATNMCVLILGASIAESSISALSLGLTFFLSDFAATSGQFWKPFFIMVQLSPTIVVSWVVGDITAALSDDFAWGLTMWAFIVPLTYLPVALCMIHMYLRARSCENWASLDVSARDKFHSIFQYLNYCFWHFNIIGGCLLPLAFCCLLVPFTAIQVSWSSANFLVPFIIGLFLVPLFFVWESSVLKNNSTISTDMLKSRKLLTLACSQALCGILEMAERVLLFPFLIVAFSQSEKSAARIANLMSFFSFLFGSIAYLVSDLTGFFRFFILSGGIIMQLGFGVSIYFRGILLNSVSGIIGMIVILGFGYGLIRYPLQAYVDIKAQNIYMLQSISSSTFQLGKAIGAAISGGIKTQVLKRNISKKLTSGTDISMAYKTPFRFIEVFNSDTLRSKAIRHAFKDVQVVVAIVCVCIGAGNVLLSMAMKDSPTQLITKIFSFKKRKMLMKYVRWTWYFWGGLFLIVFLAFYLITLIYMCLFLSRVTPWVFGDYSQFPNVWVLAVELLMNALNQTH